jgi:hypothetical protein
MRALPPPHHHNDHHQPKPQDHHSHDHHDHDCGRAVHSSGSVKGWSTSATTTTAASPSAGTFDGGLTNVGSHAHARAHARTRNPAKPQAPALRGARVNVQRQHVVNTKAPSPSRRFVGLKNHTPKTNSPGFSLHE